MQQKKMSLLGLCVCLGLLSGFSVSANAQNIDVERVGVARSENINGACDSVFHSQNINGERSSAALPSAPSFQLENMVITATRIPLTEKSVPMSVEVVTRDDIEKMGAMSVVDALKFVPGINMNHSSSPYGGHSLKMRGMDNYHTLVLVDGKRIAGENTKVSMNKASLERISISDVERIEVIYGNSSSVYGSDAMGGVINIITRKDKDAVTDMGVYSSSDQSGVNYSYNTGSSGKLKAKISARADRFRKRDFYNYVDPKDSSSSSSETKPFGYRRYLDLNLDYSFDDDHGIEFSANFMKDSLKKEYRSKRVSVSRYTNNLSDYNLRYYGKDAMHDYDINVYTNLLQKNRFSMFSGKPSLTKYEIKQIEAHDSIKLNDAHTFTVGGEFGSTCYMSDKLAEKDKTVNTNAFYIEDQWNLNKKCLLIPALRLDYHENYGHELTPKISGTVSLSDNARFKVNYGKGFRAPTIFELYAYWISGWHPIIIGNDKLVPEKSVNFDVSLEGEKGKTFAKLTYFHNDVKDLIGGNRMPNDTGAPGRFKYVMANKGDYEIQGVEGEVQYEFDKHWSLTASYNYLHAVNSQTDRFLDERAKNRGQLRLSYESGGERPLTVNIWNDWTGDYILDDDVYEFSTTGIVAHKKISDISSVYVGIDNIFDKKYDLDKTDNFRLEGRTWRFGMETRI